MSRLLRELSSSVAALGQCAGLGVLCLVATACPADVTQDFTETSVVADPIELVNIIVDSGTIVAVTYDRATMMLKRHTFGFPSDLPLPPDATIEDGVYRFEAHCMGSDFCTWDHMLELPLGVGFDILMNESRINLGKTDGDIVADYDVGDFKGTRLESANVTITSGRSDALLEFAAPPENVTIDIREGDVTLTVPVGSYRCVFRSDTGEVETADITCDDAATAVLDVRVGRGDISVSGTTP
ncbi:hypothetical protein [Nannocystis radixulma]|uniref:Adhesin domain-containing protein n=1 Tax=Nannocystis radixulma TaxID=2995305 RepID=A0ABT5B5L0_9BACT|nr:hypothetical protein [Nannocystis radixulma]MDC0669399.1 hypothetical protein [Nannocystis radixulma]